MGKQLFLMQVTEATFETNLIQIGVRQIYLFQEGRKSYFRASCKKLQSQGIKEELDQKELLSFK